MPEARILGRPAAELFSGLARHEAGARGPGRLRTRGRPLDEDGRSAVLRPPPLAAPRPRLLRHRLGGRHLRHHPHQAGRDGGRRGPPGRRHAPGGRADPELEARLQADLGPHPRPPEARHPLRHRGLPDGRGDGAEAGRHQAAQGRPEPDRRDLPRGRIAAVQHGHPEEAAAHQRHHRARRTSSCPLRPDLDIRSFLGVPVVFGDHVDRAHRPVQLRRAGLHRAGRPRGRALRQPGGHRPGQLPPGRAVREAGRDRRADRPLQPAGLRPAWARRRSAGPGATSGRWPSSSSTSTTSRTSTTATATSSATTSCGS
ncbi:MAG: hypothetical protein MZU79_07570 [Anaerotruncus sp.]|nr:hypothetical protein [Anaerotruncus sp.]